MATDIFHNSSNRIPDDDPRVVRIGFDKEDIGARRSHLPTNVKNTNTIQHITQANVRGQ